MIGSYENHADGSGVEEAHADEAAAPGDDHDETGVVDAVIGRAHHRGHRDNTEAGDRHRPAKRGLRDTGKDGKEGEPQHTQETGADQAEADQPEPGEVGTADDEIKRAEDNVEEQTAGDVETDDAKRVLERFAHENPLDCRIAESKADIVKPVHHRIGRLQRICRVQGHQHASAGQSRRMLALRA